MPLQNYVKTSETTRILNTFLDKIILCSHKDGENGFCLNKTIKEISTFCELHTSLNHYLHLDRYNESNFCFSWAKNTIRSQTPAPKILMKGLTDKSPKSHEEAIQQIENLFLEDSKTLTKLWKWQKINWDKMKY